MHVYIKMGFRDEFERSVWKSKSLLEDVSAAFLKLYRILNLIHGFTIHNACEKVQSRNDVSMHNFSVFRPDHQLRRDPHVRDQGDGVGVHLGDGHGVHRQIGPPLLQQAPEPVIPGDRAASLPSSGEK